MAEKNLNKIKKKKNMKKAYVCEHFKEETTSSVYREFF